MRRDMEHRVHESIGNPPTVKKLRREASAFDALGWLLRNEDTRKTVRDITEELDGLVSLADNFYRLLGLKNWVFSNALDLDRMRKVVVQPTPEEAERKLIASRVTIYCLPYLRVSTPGAILPYNIALRSVDSLSPYSSLASANDMSPSRWHSARWTPIS